MTSSLCLTLVPAAYLLPSLNSSVMHKANADSLFLLLCKAENRDLVARLLKGGVDFVVVGSSALAYYGLREITDVGDLDLLVNDTKENAERVLSVLSAAGVPVNATTDQLARPRAQIKLKGGTQYWADILTSTEEIPFDQVLTDAVIVIKDGLTLKVASIAYLRCMKEITLRDGGEEVAKHEADLERLRNA